MVQRRSPKKHGPSFRDKAECIEKDPPDDSITSIVIRDLPWYLPNYGVVHYCCTAFFREKVI